MTNLIKAWWLNNSMASRKSYIFYDGTMKTETDGTRLLYDKAPKSGRNNITLADGQMLDFDGVSDYVDGGEITLTNIGTNIVSFIAPRATVSNRYIYGKQTTQDRNYARIDSGELILGLGGSLNISTGIIPTEGDYIRLSVVYNENNYIVYINGVTVYNETYAGSIASTGSVLIGDHTIVDGYFDSSIGNVQFWNKALTPQQVAYDFNNPEKALYVENDILKSDNPDVNVADCVSWYPLVEGQGDYVRDMVSYGEGMELVDLAQFNTYVTDDETVTIGSDYIYLLSDGDACGAYYQGISIGDVFLLTFMVNSISGSGQFYNSAKSQTVFGSTGTKSFIFSAETNRLEFKRTGVCEWNISNISLKQLSGITKISNTAPDTVAWVNGRGSSKGIQTTAIKRDSLGKLIGLADGYDLHGQVPALPLDMTDTQLGSKFVIEFVIERELKPDIYDYILYTRHTTTNTGLQIYPNATWSDGVFAMYVFQGDGNGNTYVSKTGLDENKHHIAFIVSETEMTMAVDGVEGTAKSHSFVPSGLNFKDSTQPSPTGSLPYFKIWTEAEFDKFDLATQYEKWLEGVLKNTALVEYTGLYTTVDGVTSLVDTGGGS